MGWLLYVIAILWSVVYDTMYAMVDREDDLKVGVKSTAILFGDADKVIIGLLQLLMLAGLMLLGQDLQLSILYKLSLGVAAGFALYQQWLIRYREPKQCFRAFLNNNWLGAVIFLGLVLEYL